MVKHGTKKERKQQILEAAVKCFGRTGYEKTTMDQIAEEAGLSKGSLYNYYKDKQTLFISILQSYWDNYEPILQEIIYREGVSAVGKLRSAITLIAEMTEHESFQEVSGLTIDFYSQMRFDADVNAKLIGFLNIYIDMLADVIREGVANGEFKPVDPRSAAIVVAGVLDGFGIYHLMELNDFGMVENSRVFIDTFVKGLQNNNR